MKNGTESVVAVLLAIAGIATIAVFVSNGSKTVNVITQAGTSFANAIRCAASPITGYQCPQATSVTSTISFGGLTL